MEKLHPVVLSEIYTEGIYHINTDRKTTTEPVPTPTATKPVAAASIPMPEIKLLGENTTGILILTNETAAPFLGTNDFTFLEKIIQATGNSLADSAIVNTLKKTHTLDQIIEHTKANKVISVGVNLFEIGLHDKAISQYECKEIRNGAIKIISAEKLSSIAGNNDKKKALWLALKRMFNI